MDRRKTMIFLESYLIWCLLNWTLDVQAYLLGIPVVVLATWLTVNLPVGQGSTLFLQPNRLLRFVFIYFPTFWWEHFKANLDVAYRVMHPRLPIRPAIVKIHTQLRSDIALTILANSMSLVPGTTTVDVRRPEGALYVHCMVVSPERPQEAAERIRGRFEPLLRQIFEPGGLS